MDPTIPLDEVVSAVSRSKRYRHVAPPVIARLAGEEIPRSKNAADAQKRTQRRLHQIFGAYHTQMPWDRLLGRLSQTAGDPVAFKQACAQVMKGHASTSERLPELDRGFYPRIFAVTGIPNRILDLACGLGPLAIPWMNLPPMTRYTACDIDLEMIRFLDGFLKLTPLPGQAMVNDLVSGPPDIEADIAFVFKTLPCLQHQTDRLPDIVRAIRAKWVVISFPTRSLGRISKGMPDTYRAMFAEVLNAPGAQVTELEFDSELVFVTRRHEER